MIKADHYGQWSHIYASFCMCSLTRATEALAFAEPNSNFPPSRFWSYVHPPKKPIRSADASAKLRVRRAHPGSFRHPHLDSTHRLAIKRGIIESSCSSIRSSEPTLNFFVVLLLPSSVLPSFLLLHQITKHKLTTPQPMQEAVEDIVIAGAGLAGLATALGLHRQARY